MGVEIYNPAGVWVDGYDRPIAEKLYRGTFGVQSAHDLLEIVLAKECRVVWLGRKHSRKRQDPDLRQIRVDEKVLVSHTGPIWAVDLKTRVVLATVRRFWGANTPQRPQIFAWHPKRALPLGHHGSFRGSVAWFIQRNFSDPRCWDTLWMAPLEVPLAWRGLGTQLAYLRAQLTIAGGNHEPAQ